MVSSEKFVARKRAKKMKLKLNGTRLTSSPCGSLV